MRCQAHSHSQSGLTRTVGLSVHVGSNFLNDLVALLDFLVLVDVPLILGGLILVTTITECMVGSAAAVAFPLFIV